MRTATSRSFNQLLNATTAEEIIRSLIQCCWEAAGNEGEPPHLTISELWYALPSELAYDSTIRDTFDRNFDRWQSTAYSSLFDCFRAIGLDVQSILIEQWDIMSDVERSQAVYFVWDNEVLRFSETPDWIGEILSIDSFTRSSDINDAVKKVFSNKYTENQKQCANFHRLYIDLSSLIHYVTQHYTTRISKRIPKHVQTPTDEDRKEIYLRIMNEKLERIHSFWQFCSHIDESLSHPLVPLIKVWLQQLSKTVPMERRKKQIAQDFLKNAHLTTRSRLPTGFLHTQGNTSEQLPLFEEIEDDIVVHALPIEIHDGEGGGRGAPLDERIFFNALLARPYGTPEPFNAVKIEPTLRDYIDWLYPNGWNRTNQLPLLQTALHKVHNKRISYDRRDWNVVQVLAMPNENTKLDDVLPLIIRYPDGVQGNGPMIDVISLRLDGLVSAPRWRGRLRLPYLWDTAKQRNGGHGIYTTIPTVKRNDQDYLLDAKGNLILTGKPYKTRRGAWAVREGNLPQKDWYHPYAVRIGEERNPQSEKIPVLTDKQLVTLFFDDSNVVDSTFWKRCHDAKRAAMDLEATGAIVIERDAIDRKKGIKGWRIIPVFH